MKNFTKTAVWDKKCYYHFGIRPSTASLYGDDPNDIVTLKLKISKDQSIPELNTKHKEADYWGWYEAKEKEFTMIYPQRFLLDMCFTYRMSAEEKRGRGKAYRLEIIDIQE